MLRMDTILLTKIRVFRDRMGWIRVISHLKCSQAKYPIIITIQPQLLILEAAVY